MSTIVDILQFGSDNDIEVGTDTQRKLGQRIRTLRKSAGWTQVEMADRLGLARQYISDLEQGKRDPSLSILQVLSDGFAISLSRFLAGL
jgi:transcriptional regulator with XRE-family HTH domain